MSQPKYIKDTWHVILVNGSSVSDNAVHRVTDYTFDDTLNAEHNQEIGNQSIVDTSYDSPQSALTLNTDASDKTLDLIRKLAHKSSGDVTQADFAGAIDYFVIPVSEDGQNIARSLFLPSQALTAVDMSWSVDGKSTVNYRFSGGQTYTFINDKKLAKIEKLANPSYSGGNTTWDATSASASANTEVFLYVDEIQYLPTAGNETGKFKWDDSTSVVTLYGVDASDSSRAFLVYYVNDTNNDDYTYLTSDASAVMGIRGDRVEIRIWNSGSAPSAYTLRLQNATVNIPLDRTALREIGTKDPIAQVLDYPLNINVTVEALESDMRLYAELAGKDFSTDTMLYASLFEAASAQQNHMEIKVFSDKDHSNLLYRITLENLRVSGHGGSLSVRGQARERWSMVCDTITFSAS